MPVHPTFPSMKNLLRPLLLAAVAAGLTLSGSAQAPAAPVTAVTVASVPDAGTVRSAIDLIRSDIKTEKAVIIASNLPLTSDESSEFWPLYNEYNVAFGRLLDERLILLKEYVDVHAQMTDAQATTLATKLFDLEAKRTELKRTWFKKFTEVVPPKKAAQFFQIESQLNAALDLLLVDSLPLIK
jgi:hypothetical protein